MPLAPLSDATQAGFLMPTGLKNYLDALRIRSIYRASKSISRFAFAPGASLESVVTCSVCGIRLTSNTAPCGRSSTRFTVRLTPSTVIEPFLAIKRPSSLGAE